jgi:hypothetical protein
MHELTSEDYAALDRETLAIATNVSDPHSVFPTASMHERRASLGEARPLRAARFACAIPIDDPSLREVVWRHLEIDAIAG